MKFIKSIKNKLTLLSTTAFMSLNAVLIKADDDMPDSFVNSDEVRQVFSPFANTLFIVLDYIAVIGVIIGCTVVLFKAFNANDGERNVLNILIQVIGVIIVGLIVLYLENILALFGLSF